MSDTDPNLGTVDNLDWNRAPRSGSVLAVAGPHVPREEEVDPTPSLRGSSLTLALTLVTFALDDVG